MRIARVLGVPTARVGSCAKTVAPTTARQGQPAPPVRRFSPRSHRRHRSLRNASSAPCISVRFPRTHLLRSTSRDARHRHIRIRPPETSKSSSCVLTLPPKIAHNISPASRVIPVCVSLLRRGLAFPPTDADEPVPRFRSLRRHPLFHPGRAATSAFSGGASLAFHPPRRGLAGAHDHAAKTSRVASAPFARSRRDVDQSLHVSPPIRRLFSAHRSRLQRTRRSLRPDRSAPCPRARHRPHGSSGNRRHSPQPRPLRSRRPRQPARARPRPTPRS